MLTHQPSCYGKCLRVYPHHLKPIVLLHIPNYLICRQVGQYIRVDFDMANRLRGMKLFPLRHLADNQLVENRTGGPGCAVAQTGPADSA